MVFGLPLQMNGQEGDVAGEVRKFASELEQEFGLPCAFGMNVYPLLLLRVFDKRS